MGGLPGGGLTERGSMKRSLWALQLSEMQARLRNSVEAEQEEVMSMQEKVYKRFNKECHDERVRLSMSSSQRLNDAAFKRLGDAHARKAAMTDAATAARELRVLRNKGVLALHKRLRSGHTQKQDDDRQQRMDALKAQDFEAYKELIKEQHPGMMEGEEGKFAKIASFLTETEEYLNKLSSKVAMVKVRSEAEASVKDAEFQAKNAGCSDEEIKAAGARAAAAFQEHSETLKKSRNMAGDAQSRYYNLAHSVQEDVVAQPTGLRPPGGATLREYQIVGLRWMVSLYNNHLNGILADEMGLGKTVQVMALIAYLMEKKKNYGPHLIIVPNAVMVNWKAELTQWLPDVRCVYYVGTKAERSRKFVTDVLPMTFNVLVTTYEFIMRDRSKLTKLDWKYIVIDEAQRLKEAKSQLNKDLAMFRTQRRLLLTGTPLQNELRELWNLLNLLLPEIFDDKQSFATWFEEQLAGGIDDGSKDSEMATETKLVVVHRLHQILVPFMLRRQVQDVEGKLPPKVAVTIKVAMPPRQAVMYQWVMATGTLKLHPEDPLRHKVTHDYAPLKNKVMELRKICNHPLLSYPYESWAIGEDILRQCGKFAVLDRLLAKFYATGHRVLLFCTMTKLLDLLEAYLDWRVMPGARRWDTGVWAPGGRARIDGSTPLEMREDAIKAFNKPDSEVFIFLLSIRAAGRGLNLQTSDTVIIYDPDANPKNEEQAIARSHRIGQTKEVRVIHLEGVADSCDTMLAHKAGTQPAAGCMQRGCTACPTGPVPAHRQSQHKQQQPLPLQTTGQQPCLSLPCACVTQRSGSSPAITDAPPTLLSDDRPLRLPRAPEGAPPQPVNHPGRPGKARYLDSIESLVRNNIQKMKIDMANEIIDAGRFDQETSMDERRATLEALLQDEDRLKVAQNEVPTNEELNRLLARSDAEYVLFQRLDKELDWPGQPNRDPDSPPSSPGLCSGAWSLAALVVARVKHTTGHEEQRKAHSRELLPGTTLHPSRERRTWHVRHSSKASHRTNATRLLGEAHTCPTAEGEPPGCCVRGLEEDVPDWLQYDAASLAGAALSTFKKQPATDAGNGFETSGTLQLQLQLRRAACLACLAHGRPRRAWRRPPPSLTAKKPSSAGGGMRGRGGRAGGGRGRSGAGGGGGRGAPPKGGFGGQRGRPSTKKPFGGTLGAAASSKHHSHSHAEADSDDGGDDDVADLSEGAPEEEGEDDYADFLAEEPAAAAGEAEAGGAGLREAEPSYSRMSIKDEVRWLELRVELWVDSVQDC
ncbi:MAG: hypothetical protein WDW38_001894 [Sanguina aurantia]